MNRDILGKGLLDHFNGTRGFEFTSYLHLPGFRGPVLDTFSPAYFFREYGEMPALEQEALSLCRGKVLDIGCGAGSHSLYLQGKGMDVTALDKSAAAIETCLKRRVKKVVYKDILEFTGIKFDTLLLLMNGIGIPGKISALDGFINQLTLLLSANGQVILDSSDIRYMYHDYEDSSLHLPEDGQYYGEGRFILEYKGTKSDEFPWLYLDPEQLAEAAWRKGLNCEFVNSGSHYDYLARLYKK
jgi:SAM-dependent methyltransferase